MIKYFESTDAGAPTMNNAAGSMIAVLDACLITGYNTKAVTSIVVASGVATVVCAAHAFANTYGKVVRIAGATAGFTALNKDTTIANVTTNGFTFLCPGVADGAATGTLTAKYAPLDWVKQYSGTNKAMYKRSDVTATGCMLRIDDSAVAVSCRALMVQSATDVDTYTNGSPTAAQVTGGTGNHWIKAYGSANATAVDWFVVADELFIYVFVKTNFSYGGYLAHFFGDAKSFRPADSLNCLVGGLTTNNDGNPLSGVNSTGACVILGGKNGISLSQTVAIRDRVDSYGAQGAVYPSLVDGGLVINYPILFAEPTATSDVRGVFPGVATPVAQLSNGSTNTFASKTQISNIVGSSNIFLIVNVASSVSAGNVVNVALINLTGPWR